MMMMMMHPQSTSGRSFFSQLRHGQYLSCRPLMLVSLLLLLNTHMAASSDAGTTIPCPGYTDPGNFTNIPLSERPKLAKILQHGYHPGLITATIPLEIPLTTGNQPDEFFPPLVHPEQGFVERPFRTLSSDACRVPWEEGVIMHCSRTGSSGFGPGTGSLVEQQMKLEFGQIYDGNRPWTQSMVNPTYNAWGDHVSDFFQSHNSQCQRHTSTLITLQTFSCSVLTRDCQILDPEFLQDLQALPIGDATTTDTDTTSLLEDYQTFVDKWGYGSVKSFQFGAVDLKLFLPPPYDEESNGMDPPTPSMHMGRVGGSKNFQDIASDDEGPYTMDECADPTPIQLQYEPWDELLEDFFYYDDFLDDPIINMTTEQLEAVSSNFRRLRWSYPMMSQQIRDFNGDLPYVNCLEFAPSSLLSASPSSQPSSSPSADSTPVPTPLTTAPTLLRPTASPSDAPTKSDASAAPNSPNGSSGTTASSASTLGSYSLNGMLAIVPIGLALHLLLLAT